MDVRVVDDADALARTAADVVVAAVDARRDALVLAATGETPMGTYAELARRRAAGAFDASGMRVAQLDEYVGVGVDDPRSLYGWTQRSVCEPLGIGSDRIIRLVGDLADLPAVCRAYDAAVAAGGGVDLAVLGLGPNGHLGFNEPPTDTDAPTRVVALSAGSLESNRRYWDAPLPVPERALTAGMASILAARRVILLVSGARKAAITARLLAAVDDPWLPASWLHGHPNAVLVADREALPDGAPAS